MSTAVNYNYGVSLSGKETYGGWVSEQEKPTGASTSFIRLVEFVVGVGMGVGAAIAAVGTGGEISAQHLQCCSLQEQRTTSTLLVADGMEEMSSPHEDLARIREVLSPAISDLAIAFGVSRQSIYNWLKGSSVGEDHAIKLRDLARAADVFEQEGISVTPVLLKRKFAHGRTLLQVAQAGESTVDAAKLLVQVYKREAAQRERLNSRFSGRANRVASADFDFPMPNDHA